MAASTRSDPAGRRRRARRRALAFALAMLAPLRLAPGARADEALPAFEDRVAIVVEPARDARHAPIEAAMRDAELLESLRAAIASFRLRRPLRVTLTGCDGDANAAYASDAVTVCYEYLDRLVALTRDPDRPADLDDDAALAGPILDVVMHEAAHALFDQFETPILGRSEDAADAFANLALLHLSGPASKARVSAVAFMYLAAARHPDPPDPPEPGAADGPADEHASPMQRRFNLLCLAYGYDPATYADLVALAGMPAKRAALCAQEHRQALAAFRLLLRPHLDPLPAARVFGPGNPLLIAP